MSDPIDAAIAATALPAEVQVVEIPVTLSSSGRPAIVTLPADATDAELVDLAGWLLTRVRAHIREAQQGPASRIIVPQRIRDA